jgi:hypothetical protein
MKEVRKEITLTAEQKKAIETVIELSNDLAEKIGVFGGWAYGGKHIGPITDRGRLQNLASALADVADIEYIISERI